jgi:predicted nuclease with TOPRIM domain
MNMPEEMKSKTGMSDEQMRSIKGQLKQLDEDMKKATTQASKDEIRQRQDELNRQLKGMEMR